MSESKEMIEKKEVHLGLPSLNEIDLSIVDSITQYSTANKLNLTKDEIRLAYFHMQKTGLDFQSRQIYCIRNQGKLQWIVSIDGLRLIAERTGRYLGVVERLWVVDGKWQDWPPARNTMAMAAKVVVQKVLVIEGHVMTANSPGLASMTEFDKGNYIWKNMPNHMLSKVAESHALRAAFPLELSGYYTEEEMGIDNSEEKEKKDESKNVVETKKIETLFNFQDLVITFNQLSDEMQAKVKVDHAAELAKSRSKDNPMSPKELHDFVVKLKAIKNESH